MSWIDSDSPQKQCCECFLWYPADNSHYARQYEGKYGLASRCKLCTREMQAILRDLKAANPKPTEGSLSASAVAKCQRLWERAEEAYQLIMITRPGHFWGGFAPPVKIEADDPL